MTSENNIPFNQGFEAFSKQWFVRMPLPSHPAPESSGENKEIVVIAPVFLTHHSWYTPEQLRDSVVKASIWARHTMLMNTDAVNHGVAVKFWVESKLEPIIRPFFEENHIDWDRDVLIAGIPDDNDHIADTGQILFGWFDKQLESFERVMILTDVFSVSPSGAPIPLFERLLNQSVIDKTKFVTWAGGRNSGVRTKDVNRMIEWSGMVSSEHLRANLERTGMTLVGFPDTMGFTDRCKYVLRKEGCDEYFETDAESTFLTENCISICPSSFIRNNQKDEMNWFLRMAKLIGNDQILLSIYAAKYNFEVFQLSNVANIGCVGLNEPSVFGIIENFTKENTGYLTHNAPVGILPDSFYLHSGIPKF